jgi:ATP-dependent RNA helicase SUPV3L1/SUV3
LKEFGRPRQDGPKEATAEGAPERAKGDKSEERSRPREHFEAKGRDQHRDKQARDEKKGKFGGERERGPREHGERERGRDKGGRDRRESGPSHRPYASSAPRERERQIDPNSPFAKLAALKEQLTANRKE